MKILLVDDSAATRSYLKVVLSLERTTVFEVENGERALLVARMVFLDLVIADVNMPRVGGIELVERFRSSSEPRLRSLPVILLTAEGSPEVERRGLAAGATAFAYKPISPPQLVALVKEIEQARRRPGSHSYPQLDTKGRERVG